MLAEAQKTKPAIQGSNKGSYQLVRKPEDEVRDLTADEYPNWDALVDNSPQSSPFYYSWWLDAVGGDTRVLGYFENGRLIAGMPLYFTRKLGFTICRMPKLTQTWGVAMEPFSGKAVNVMSRQIQVLGAFAEYATRFPIFQQTFHPDVQNWLPFYWKGFRQTSRVTYVLEDLSNWDEVWAGMSHSTRGEINKATKMGFETVPCSSDVVFDAAEKSLEKQGIKMPYDRPYLSRLCSAAKTRGYGECFATVDKSGTVCAANFVLWNRQRAYFLAGGINPASRNTGAGSYQLWQIIRVCSAKAKVFDFEGSMLAPIERFFRGFGARQVTYHQIVRVPAILRAYLAVTHKL